MSECFAGGINQQWPMLGEDLQVALQGVLRKDLISFLVDARYK
jgi:hypothetical protein